MAVQSLVRFVTNCCLRRLIARNVLFDLSSWSSSALRA